MQPARGDRVFLVLVGGSENDATTFFLRLVSLSSSAAGEEGRSCYGGSGREKRGTEDKEQDAMAVERHDCASSLVFADD